jgi:iron complex outermembrane recepter protein
MAPPATRASLAALLIVLVPSPIPAATPQEPSGRRPEAIQEAGALHEEVEVVGFTPLHGLGIARLKLPANVQRIELERSGPAGEQDLPSLLVSQLATVQASEAQANPFQPDLVFRGFLGSPLLGAAQGIAVYQDGVRLNDPFGDTVHWDLVPTVALAEVELVPGSNPLFGLNALGGAVSLRTVDGFTGGGHRGRVWGGSFGGRRIEARSGGSRGSLGYFLAGNVLEEDGWRDHSPSRLAQVFGSATWRGSGGFLGATLTGASNRLNGNGPSPVELLGQDRQGVFTHPDVTSSSLGMIAVRGQRSVGAGIVLEGMTFYRGSRIRTFNGDETDLEPCAGPTNAGLLCREEGGGEERVQEASGKPAPASFGGLPVSAVNNKSRSRMHAYGGTAQATYRGSLAGRDHHLVAGASVDRGTTGFGQESELASLTEERGTIGSGLYDASSFVRLDTRLTTWSLFAADAWSLTPRLTLTASARFNATRLELRDRLGTELTGDHTFHRLNPSAGLTYQVAVPLNLYAGYSESSRTPTAVELTCADPDDPCRLPNAFLSDPPLHQVVARTWEAGARGIAGRARWNASLFATAIGRDIIFISSGRLRNAGHFANVGDTRRVGLEASADAPLAGLARAFVSYSWLSATFRTPLTINSPNHPGADDDEIRIQPGDRLPGVPVHSVRAGLVTTVSARATLGAHLLVTSARYLRGDEVNAMRPVPGFGLVGLTGRLALGGPAALVGRVDNLLDRRYETFGLLGEPDEVLGDAFTDPRFLSPGAPRSAWAGFEVSF